jgi:hypothetical protein
VWARFSSPCASFASHLGLSSISTVLLSLMSWLLPFSLILNRFHWFNIVRKLVFSEVTLLFASRRDMFRLRLDLFRASILFCGHLGPLCPLSTALMSVELLTLLVFWYRT